MHLLSYAQYFGRATSLLGVLMLAAMIWFIGPSIAFEGYRPLASVAVRLVIIGLILVGVAAVAGYQYWKRRRASRALAEGISAEQTDDSEVLGERMKDALQTLQKARGTGGDYLYSIPWYLIIGPPGAGKTTALINSGLRFPLMAGGGQAMVEGIGGTRYCDWWFSEDAVLIDTAGRYTTQDSHAEGEQNLDKQSWLAFLDLLRKHRSRQPINGVIIGISLEDLISLPEEERNAHADAIRSRLVELYEHLGVTFPVYAMFTKADLVAGFNEYFGDLRESERRAVWGATFQTEDRTRNTVGEVGSEFDALVERLSEMVPDRVQSEPNQARRALAFGFPMQVAALREPITAFLSRVFEPTRYHVNAILRGFYFTSGTQEGSAIDQLIGATARSLGSQADAQLYSGKGRSYFIHDMLTKVIFGEAGWVSSNRRAARRAALARTLAYGALAGVVVLALTLWGISYYENSRLLAENTRAIQDYRTNAAAILAEPEVSDPDLARVLQLVLQPLRGLPVGYGSREAAAPLSERWGLSQRGRILPASEESYHQALERVLRPRLILRLEEQLQQNLQDPTFVYEALKVYLMLGEQIRADEELIVAWMRRDWEESLYPGEGNRSGRQALEAHLRAMLHLAAGSEPLVSLNGSLVEQAQSTLARISVAELGFALLSSQAATLDLPDWVLTVEAGADADLVFEAADGGDITRLRVPGFFTYRGFHHGFLARLATVADQLEREYRVLGEAGAEREDSAELERLPSDLLRIYEGRFIAEWRAMLDRIRMAPMIQDAPNYTALGALSSSRSPLKRLLQSVRQETSLTREPPAELVEVSDDNDTLDTGPLLREGADGRRPDAPGATAEAEFDRLHELVGENGAPIDEVIEQLTDIHERLLTAAISPTQAPDHIAAVPPKLASLRAAATRLPEPVSRLLLSVAEEIEADITDAAIGQLRQDFRAEVTQACEQVIANRYPFFNSDRDVPLGDFTRLFAPGGIIESFREENLDNFIDQSGETWRWRAQGSLADELSDETLLQFQRADEITEAFFARGGQAPSVELTVTPLSLDPEAENAILKINNARLESRPDVSSSAAVEWPGPNADNHSAIAVRSGAFGQVDTLERRGPWGFFRLLEAGQVLVRGDSVVANFSVAGRRVSYEFTAGTLANPLTLPALREFRCPAGL